jgi:hypothetical protein
MLQQQQTVIEKQGIAIDQIQDATDGRTLIWPTRLAC